ncbi:raffinose/stachyose/melibiose transport system permease protein [Paenibacillus sp. UNCCL117]|uniref:carbohydrate ABC transporter permease n=1 Tax=unclassified Paenibacillus TaxID=185978 RepID=UPI000891A941|nr:raffinose/stachyose/melibiose transport system permease protein [Paenibacillus sp. cl123]SFW67549.1 raffinose/stachyose/melibiose transport system permease protein [Paenibacillus sp. UNCCL117]
MEATTASGKAAAGLSPTAKLARQLRSWLANGLLTLYALLTLYPLVWLFISSFKSNQEFYGKPFSLPSVWQIENFTRAWKVAGLGTAMTNSVIVTFCSMALTLLLGTLAAYVLSRLEFKLKGFIMALFVLGMLIPIHSTLVPLFIMMKSMGILDSYAALILPYTAFELPVAIFVVAAYLTSVPKEVEEAAMIDGNGYWGIFFRVIFPLSVPAMATVSILAFLRFWNDFAFALVFINKNALKTLPLSLSIFSDGFGTDYSLTMAAMAIAVIPTIVIYLIFQEQIMKGMVAGAVKG